MKQTVDRCMFIDSFKAHGRQDSFSHWGLNALWDYFEEYEQGTGEEIELDVVAICCEYNESTLAEFKNDYPDYADIEDIDELVEKVSESTSVVDYGDDVILYVAF